MMSSIQQHTLTADVDTSRRFARTKLAGVFLSMLILAGCACQPKTEYRVADIPEPPRVERPVLDSVNIDGTMDPGTIIQAFRSDIKRLQSTILEYEKILDSYRKKDSK